MDKLVEKVPGWVERLLIPTLESRIRAIVKEEVSHLEKVMEARFEAVSVGIESLEKRLPMVQDLAEIKAKLAEVERRISAC